MFMEELGIRESGLSRLIKLSYAQLGLISYLTAGPKEVRAWTIERGTRLRRPPVRFTPTSSAVLSARSASPTTTSSPAAP